MNIVQIIPGSGGSFYCGNCLRDSKYVVALREQGHQVIKIPMYLPIFSDEHDLEEIPVFYGAVSIYLKQLYPIFRKAPAWIDRILNSKPILKMAASQAGSTNARGLEEMTVSMLLGEDGSQNDELERLVDWLEEHCKPDVVHISNALLLGLAHRIKERLNVKIVCSLQDEDVWVDAMQPDFQNQIWKLMSEKAKDVDLFIGVSHFFSKVMEERMNIPSEKIRSLYLGVDPEDYEFIPTKEKKRNIGYISRMCPENGLDILVDAFIQLKRNTAFNDVKLFLTGGSTGADTKYIAAIIKRIAKENLMGEVEFLDDFEDSGRMEFFRRVSVVSVPVRNGEAFGMYLLESMASGTPVIQPTLGAFPEIIGLSGGGVTYEPNTPEALCATLTACLSDSKSLNNLSLAARNGVEVHFNIHDHAKEMIEVYQKL
ncbi:MAG: glycosyltransferase family 4 protein [Mariniphaga sp.]